MFGAFTRTARVCVLVGLALGGLALFGVAVPHARGAGQGSLNRAQRSAKSLSRKINSNSRRIRSIGGSVAHVKARLARVQAILDEKRRRLANTRDQLRRARSRLAALQADLAQATRSLSDNLVQSYKAGRPDVVTVVVESHGFADLLERVNFLKRAQKQDAKIVTEVRRARVRVAAATSRLGDLEAGQQSVASQILTQRDEIARIKLGLLKRQSRLQRARGFERTRLHKLGARVRSLGRQLGVVGPGAVHGNFSHHGGAYGFFPAPGTDYSVGDEPHLASRLDALGKALHLHLIGISGYRSPQHSVEVGGFANDPHTHGQASDTPGVEGVSEATLNRFGLTRPFGGAAEADHIQLK
ncbi:MAG TPA: hypothetical protein VHE14_09150 [Solirubrobacteraceae bacterium]|nr:hypothetical protein [Solirubrobacteraceae bacterium]